MALCGIECIELTDDVRKILSIYFSYNKKFEQEKNVLNHISKIQNTLKSQRLRNLTVVTGIPTSTIKLLTKIQVEFTWKEKNPKIKNSTLCNDYENGRLKSVDIFSKVVSLQCSWIKRLLDNNFHQWKIIPLYLIRQYLGKNFKFHSNLDKSHSILCKFPKFYKEIFTRWVKIFLHRLHCHQQLHISLFGITSIFKLVIKAFICIFLEQEFKFCWTTFWY